jgi:hypothetical protein
MSDTTQSRRLAFGYESAVPADTAACWGARLILDRMSYKFGGDMLPDRQGNWGVPTARTELHTRLNTVKPWGKPLADLICEGKVQDHVENEVTLYEDDHMAVVGNSNGSYGYFYIAAWLKVTQDEWAVRA